MTRVFLQGDGGCIRRDYRGDAPGISTSVAIDDEAIALICRHEGRGLESLYDRYAVPVYSLILRIVRSVGDAEDVTQEVFTQVWMQAPRYDRARGTVPAWMLVIARSRAVDRLRRRRPEDDVVVDDLPSTGATALEGVIADQRAHLARTALAALPVAERLALQLAYFEGLTQAEIAVETATPIGSVKTRIRRGLQRLRVAVDGPTRA